MSAFSEKCFSLLYDGQNFFDLASDVSRNGESVTYRMPDGFVFTNEKKTYPEYDAVEWVNRLQNAGDAPSGIVSELWDCDLTLPFPHVEKAKPCAWLPDEDEYTTVLAPTGSTWTTFEFACNPDTVTEAKYPYRLFAGQTAKYAASGGRSSENQAPFFHLHQAGKGIIFAIGWTGQWNCEISREEDTVRIRTKIEDTHFRLLPGESVRTSSVVVMAYEGSIVEGQNQWRRLVKKHFSLIGKPGREQQMPLCAGIWGGMSTKAILARIETIKKEKLPFEYLWIDAGWYGMDDKPCPDEFEGDWASYTGDWRVNPTHHPDGLRDIAAAVKEAGLKLLLWVEPERVIYNTPIVSEHEDWFTIFSRNPHSQCLLNLGKEEAWQYCYQTLCDLIERFDVRCYRQDFNMSPLPYWRKNDAEDRQGITEIKHITGMYRLWDALLERFPHLIIDNCASGGRRIDIETLRRSVPLWRSDAQCPANFPAYIPQSHNVSFSAWLPYNGNGCGRMTDTYRIRSAYAGGLTTNFSYSERDSFGDDPEMMRWLKDRLNEYIELRPYYYGDMFPLTEISDREDVWSAVQFHRRDKGDGIVEIFRRKQSPYETAVFSLGGLDKTAVYRFTDLDTGKTVEMTGMEAHRAFPVSVPTKETAVIYTYTRVSQ